MYSGGKDSTATVILCHQHNIAVDLILMSEVMYDQNTSGENPEHIKFIKEVCFPKFKEWGYNVKIVRADKTFVDYFYRVKIRGKHIGSIYGFPSSGMCYANGCLKVDPINDFLKGKNYIQYQGIAIDEPKRLIKMHARKNTISILERYKYTEIMAKRLCLKYGLLSPIYKTSNRGGCWFCPNKSKNELRELRNNHRTLWNNLLELEKAPNKTYDTFAYGKRYSDMEELFLDEDRQLKLF